MYKNYTTRQELAEIWGITCEGAKKRIAKLGLYCETIEGVGRGGKIIVYPIECLPQELKKQVLEYRAKDLPLELKKSLGDLKEWQREVAYNRYKLLQYLKQEIIDERNRFRTKQEVLNLFLKKFKSGEIDKELLQKLGCPSARTINRWLRRYNLSGENIASLAPLYGKREGKTKLKEQEKEYIIKEYCKPHGMSVRYLFYKYIQFSKMRRINLYTAVDDTGRTISYFTFARFIKSIPESIKILTREGKEAFRNKVLPSIERDYSKIFPNQLWFADGHTFNFFAKDDLFGSGKVIRPTIVGWIDAASRKIMGFAIHTTENTELISNSLENAICWNKNLIPDHILIDNGKAFKNKQTLGFSRKLFAKIFASEESEKMVEGLYGRLGIKVHFAIAYNPQAKPIERLWGTIDNYFSRRMITYTGKDAKNKPENLTNVLKNENNIPLLSEVFEMFKMQMEEYNSLPHTGKEMNGKTPDEVYKELINKRPVECKYVSEKDLAIILMMREKRIVQRQGIKWNKWWYRDEMGLMNTFYLNREVMIAYNPSDFTHIFVLDKAGRVLFRANRVIPATFDVLTQAKDSNQYRQIGGLKKKISKLTKELYKAKGDLNAIETTIETELEKNRNLINSSSNIEKWEENLKDFGE
ncbi:MAG: transposase domain-containing protein [Candidatus Pacearchaeota archaeon]